MLRKSYSQNAEDEVAARHLASIHCLSRGVFLDVGANDGLTFSNTRAFVDELEWEGTYVDPDPRNVAALERLGGLLIPCVVTPEPDEAIVQLWATQDSLLSTTELAHRQKWTSRGCKFAPLYSAPTIDVASLVKKHFEHHSRGPTLVSIDTEGTSAALFIKMRELLSPKVWIVEMDLIEQRIEALAWAKAAGYETLASNAENLVLGRR